MSYFSSLCRAGPKFEGNSERLSSQVNIQVQGGTK